MKMFNKITAIAMAAAVMAGFAAPVCAAGVTYTGVNGGSVKVEKYLIMDRNTNVPVVEFEYGIALGQSQNASSGNLMVFGANSGSISGTPTVTNAVFANNTTTYNSVQTIPTDTGTQLVENTLDPVTLTATQKYARASFTVDFTNVTFTEPGVYRYILTETGTSPDTAIDSSIALDTDTSRVLDIYVTDSGSGVLAVQGYVLHNNENAAVVPIQYAESNPSTKTNGFISTFTTYDLTIRKEVSGNQASRDEYFDIAVTISDQSYGSGTIKFDVDRTNADETTRVTGLNAEAHNNPAQMNSNGQPVHFYLQNGQSIIIRGLPKNAVYSIAEDATTLANEGYTMTASITEGSAASQDATVSSNTVSDPSINADSTVVLTNAKSGTIPTGILTSVLPGVTVIGCAGIALAAAMKRRQESR